MNTIPIIDYANHPAFSEFAVDRPKEDLVHAEMLAIDRHFEAASSSTAFEVQSRPHWSRIKGLLDSIVDNDSLRERSKMAIDESAKAMIAYVSWKSKRKKRVCRDENAKQLLESLHTNGAAVLRVPDDVRKQLYEGLAEERAMVEQRHAMNPIDRCVYHMKQRGPNYELLHKALVDLGLLEAVSCLFGRNVKVIYWYLGHNSSSEAWYKGCYQDVGVETSPLAYAHFDNDFDLAKAQLYLTDVDEENGPFAFVPGSHNWSGSKTQQFVFKQMDRQFKYPKDERFYYRPRFGSPEYRKEFMQLPKSMQGSSHLGDDLLGESEMCREIEASFNRVTSDKGNCCVFAGGDLLHYGGIVQGDDRWVLQLGLAAEQPYSAGPAPKRSIFRKILSKLHRTFDVKPVRLIGNAIKHDGQDPPQNEYRPNA